MTAKYKCKSCGGSDIYCIVPVPLDANNPDWDNAEEDFEYDLTAQCNDCCVEGLILRDFEQD